MNKLGYGSIWFNQKWPLHNENYNFPLNEEINNFMNNIFILNKNSIVMIDTASEYKNEHLIGGYFNNNKDKIEHSFICTKCGKILENKFDFSYDTIKSQFYQSYKFLPKIDLLYVHMVYHSPINQCIDFFLDKNISNFIEKIKKEKKIHYFGASISNPNTLQILFSKNLIKYIDFLQVPSWFLNEESSYNIIEKVQNSGVKIVVNSPIRYLKNNDFREAYIKLFKNQKIDYILTGTRNNLRSTFKYFQEYKD